MIQRSRPLIIGLTGSIGMGKSTVAAMFEDQGISVFDADATVHRLQGPSGALLEQIETAFPGTTGPQGTDRQALGAAVLGNSDKLALLESIIHPAVAKERAHFFESHKNDDIVVFDIPLLFEKGGSESVDVIIVVSAPQDIQRARVMARQGMTLDKFEKILKLQMPDAEKRQNADYIIDTGQTLDSTRVQVQNIIKNLRAALAHNNK
jgi:dephospho-CoA kinase